MEVIGPNVFLEKLQTFYNKAFKSAEDLVGCKDFLHEVLKAKQYL